MSLVKTAPAALALLALVACQTEDTATDKVNELATVQAAPPGAGGLTLAIDGGLIPGNQITFNVSGAQPNETVFMVRGSDFAAGNFCPAPLNGLCIDMLTPSVQFQMQANAQGNASRTITVPNIPAGAVATFQAATPGSTAATSDVVAKFNLLPAGSANRTLGVIVIEDAVVTPGASYDGIRQEIYFSNAIGLDVCILDISGSSTGLTTTGPCAACDWAFDVDYTAARDGSISGDCIDMLSFDPASVQPFSIPRGYAPSYYADPAYPAAEAVFAYDDANYAWALYVFSTNGVPNSIFDPTTGVFNWGVDFGEYLPY